VTKLTIASLPRVFLPRLDLPFSKFNATKRYFITKYRRLLFTRMNASYDFSILKFLQLDGTKEYKYHPPTQLPINPPYKHACQLKAASKLQQEYTPSTTQKIDEKTLVENVASFSVDEKSSKSDVDSSSST